MPFRGLSAFPITPTDAAGKIDTDALGRLLERICEARVDSIGLLGSTGSYMYLTRAERRRAVEAALACVDGRVPVIVGVGALRTDAAIDLAGDAADAGADALLLAPVSYTPLTDEEVYQHYAAVAGATRLPLCIYNNPGTTHFSFSKQLLLRLAGLPNIAAVKMPLCGGSNFQAELEELRAGAPSGFAIGYSGDWGAAAALLAGADAWYSVIGGLLPNAAVRLTRAAQAGHERETRSADALFQPLWSLFKEFGSIRVIYAAANLLGLTEAQPPLPILPLGAADRQRVAAALHAVERIDHGS